MVQAIKAGLVTIIMAGVVWAYVGLLTPASPGASWAATKTAQAPTATATAVIQVILPTDTTTSTPTETPLATETATPAILVLDQPTITATVQLLPTDTPFPTAAPFIEVPPTNTPETPQAPDPLVPQPTGDLATPPDPEAPEQAMYASSIMEVVELYQQAFAALGPLYDQASSDPAIFLNDEWKSQIGFQFSVLREAGQRARAIVPPADLQPIHEQLLLAASHYDNAVNLFTAAIDTLDATKMTEGAQALNNGHAAFGEATRLLNEFGE